MATVNALWIQVAPNEPLGVQRREVNGGWTGGCVTFVICVACQCLTRFASVIRQNGFVMS